MNLSDFLAKLAPYSKAFMPTAVAVVLYGLSLLGVTGDMTVSDAITALLMSAVVYFVPNKKVTK